jgi:uncharacterized protein (DUF427 family)
MRGTTTRVVTSVTPPLRSVAETVSVLTNRLRLLPGPRHPITVSEAEVRVVVRHEGRVIADSRSALTLREADYPAVHYLPRRDVDLSALEASSHTSYCPFKGEASYFSLAGGGDAGTNAVWSYEDPFDAVPEIKGYLAFYANRVEIAEQPLR